VYYNTGANRLLMHVQIASENDKEKWNLFVDRECGSFFHYYDWKYIYECKKRNRYIPLLIRDSTDSILGIFPVVEQPGPIYPSLSSLPEGASDGFLLNSNLNVHEKDLVVQSFLDYIDNNYSQSHAFFSLRHHLSLSNESIQPSHQLMENGYQWRDNLSTKLPCTYIVHLEKPFKEKIFSSMVKNLRNRIRHAKRCGAHVIIDDNFTFFDDFAQMHMEMVKKFGLVTKKEEYDQILKIFRKKIKLFVCFVDSEPITALLNYYTPTIAYGAIGPYNPKAKSFQNNTLPMCASIRYACDAGYQNFDMGITQTSSLAAYKEKFGAIRIPLIIYQKKFSYFKLVANKTAGSFQMGGEKMVDLLRL
jgi:lipid II:glycine glycyltransferase (peptidoglycan interpeptide bridge formation enzyme)